MIKLPAEIAHMIKAIEDAGFEAYAVGGCVRDSILGRSPEDWDLTSNASRADLEALFPDAQIVNKKLGVMRITEGEITADIAAYRIDGEYRDYRRPESVVFTNEIGEDLRRRDFTMNAIAISPDRGVVDPYHGREDIGRRLIRGIGDPGLRFEEDALRILRAVRFAAQLNFAIDGDTLKAMGEKVYLLQHISVERVREEFVKTLTGCSCGTGLTLYREIGALPCLLGRDCMENVTDEELERFDFLAGRIERTGFDVRIRTALVYQCFEKTRALGAIEILGYSNEMKKLLRSAVLLTEELEQIGSKTELKRFICKAGTELYRYLTGLSVQRLALEWCDEAGLKRRGEMLEEILQGREAIFIGDLVIGGNDLKEIGVKEGAVIGRILKSLLDAVHQSPELNTRELLLGLAGKLY